MSKQPLRGSKSRFNKHLIDATIAFWDKKKAEQLEKEQNVWGGLTEENDESDAQLRKLINEKIDMKSKRAIPKVSWTKERYEEQIGRIKEDLRNYSTLITDCDKKISHALHDKKMYQAQQSKKNRYLSQLKKDFENLFIEKQGSRDNAYVPID